MSTVPGLLRGESDQYGFFRPRYNRMIFVELRHLLNVDDDSSVTK